MLKFVVVTRPALKVPVIMLDVVIEEAPIIDVLILLVIMLDV